MTSIYDRWCPLGVKRGYSSDRPVVGDTVAYDRGAYVVTHVADAEPVEGEQGHDGLRPPYTMTLRRVHGPISEYENSNHERGLRIPARAYKNWETYDEGRVPLCSCCGHPWPCLISDAAAEAKARGEALNAKMDRAAPGQCYACGEVITHRQGAVTYPEPNVELLGFPAPRFHTRQSCAGAVYEYERKRAKALPDAAPVMDSGPAIPGL